MKNIPTQKRAIEKRIALLKAAVDEFSESGFEVATAKSIANRAGVATGTFYQYFENKNDILRVIAQNRFVELHQHISLLEPQNDVADFNRPSKTFKRVLSFLYDYHLQDRLLHQVLDQRRGIDPLLDEIMGRGEDLIRSHVTKFLDHFDLAEVDVIADSLFAMGEGLVHRMVFGKTPADPEKMLDIGAEMLASYFSNMTDTAPS